MADLSEEERRIVSEALTAHRKRLMNEWCKCGDDSLRSARFSATIRLTQTAQHKLLKGA